MRGLKGKVAIIAGGGGIGDATALRLAGEGVSIALGDVFGDRAAAVAAQIEAGGGRAVGLHCDIADDASVAGLVAAAVTAFGGVDFLHCNAADTATATRDCDALDLPLEVFDRTMNVNLRGHLLCTRHALPEILKRGGGAVIYTTSPAAFIGEPDRVAYAVSKSGMNALMRHVASHWGKENIRSNGVAPGLVLTEKVIRNLPEEFCQRALERTRSPRLGQPDDIAAMVAFLMSDDGAWINGQVISVDGGGTMR